MRPLQQVRRRGRRRAQSASARGGLAPSLKMVPPAKISAENHSQAGAARPRAGPETIVRLTAYVHTRVKGQGQLKKWAKTEEFLFFTPE